MCFKRIFGEFIGRKPLKILLYGAEDFSSQMNYEILKCTIKFIKKQIALVALYFFPSFLSFFFTLTKYLAFNIFSMSLMFYVQSLYRIYSKRYMSSVSFVSCLILFYLLLFLIYLWLVSRCTLLWWQNVKDFMMMNVKEFIC